MKALCWVSAIVALAGCIFLFAASRPNSRAAIGFQAYSTGTTDMLKQLEDQEK